MILITYDILRFYEEMTNSWFPNSLVSPLNPPATAGSLNRPPPLPRDPPDPSSPSDFPSLATGRLLPRKPKIFHKSQIVSAPVKVTSPTSESFPPPTEVVSVAQLLSSYLVSSSNLSQNPRSGTIPTGSETAIVATVATVFLENLNSSTTSTIPSPPQSLPGILGATPASFPQSSIPPLQSSKLDYVVINGSSISNLTSLPPISNPNPPPPKAATGSPSYASKVKPSVDKSLKRLSPVSFSPSGIPRVEIPDEVFHKGAELHKDFLICRFFGRIPSYHLTQSVLNFMWGKGKHLEIHLSPAGNSVLVRLPNDYIRQKVLEKRIWYVETTMFHVSQWSASLDNSSPSLQRIPLWAHLKDVPFDLIHQQGLSHIAGLIGEPIETDDWTINLTSISIAHVKVEVDSTKPLPPVLEVLRSDGSIFTVKVDYPWVPPVCSHCQEVGHIMRNCLLAPPPTAASQPAPPPKSSGPQVVPHACYLCKEVGHFLRNCPKAENHWTQSLLKLRETLSLLINLFSRLLRLLLLLKRV